MKPLAVVETVDLVRYQGIWYEIARYPNRFEKNCVAATAEYTLQTDGTFRVVNRCRHETLDGPVRQAVGKAWVPDPATPAKLKVRFFWPFSGHYWILDLAEDYSWVVVGEPKRRYLWILARTPTLGAEVLDAIAARLPASGYETARLEFPPQRETAPR